MLVKKARVCFDSISKPHYRMRLVAKYYPTDAIKGM